MWSASTAVPVNTIIKIADYEYYKCIVSGTTGSSAPSWNQGSDITDNTAHWKYLGDKPYIYGEPFDYGVPEYQAALFRTAYIHSLQGKDVYLEGNINALGGTFRGSLKTPQLETTEKIVGQTLQTPSPTWYHDSNIWDAFSGLAEGIYTASGSFNGRTVSRLYRATATNEATAAEINYYNLTYAGTVSSNGWQEVASYTSVINGYVRVHVATEVTFHLWGGYGYVRIQVNGVTVLEGTNHKLSPSGWEYFNSGDFWINPGDRVSLQLSSGGDFQTEARYFRVFPTLSTVGIECTDGSIWAVPGGWRNTADSITANGTTFTASRNYWKGSEYIALFLPVITKYVWTTADNSVSFNGKPNSNVFLDGTGQLRVEHTDGSVDLIGEGGYFNITGSVKFIDNHGSVKVYNYDLNSMIETVGSGIIDTGSNTNGGWYKFSNGMMLCFKIDGTWRTTASGVSPVCYYNESFTFPKPFTNIYLVLSIAQDNQGDLAWPAEVTELSTTGVSVYVAGRSSIVQTHPGYIAIGAWK